MRDCSRIINFFFFSSRRRHTRCSRDWSSDVCSSDLQPFCIEGYLHCLSFRQIVVNDGGDGNLITLAEKARHRQSHHQILAHEYIAGRASHLRSRRYAPYRRSPTRKRIRELHLNSRPPAGVCVRVSLPERCVREEFPYFRLNRDLRLQLCKGPRRVLPLIRKEHRFLSGRAAEIERQ